MFLLLLLSEGEIIITFLYERVNINCAQVNSTAEGACGRWNLKFHFRIIGINKKHITDMQKDMVYFLSKVSYSKKTKKESGGQ